MKCCESCRQRELFIETWQSGSETGSNSSQNLPGTAQNLPDAAQNLPDATQIKMPSGRFRCDATRVTEFVYVAICSRRRPWSELDQHSAPARFGSRKLSCHRWMQRQPRFASLRRAVADYSSRRVCRGRYRSEVPRTVFSAAGALHGKDDADSGLTTSRLESQKSLATIRHCERSAPAAQNAAGALCRTTTK